MANINQVKIWLKAGEKVRKPYWGDNSYWQLSKDGYERIIYSDGTSANIYLKQLEDSDWELYKEDEYDLFDVPKKELIRELFRRALV